MIRIVFMGTPSSVTPTLRLLCDMPGVEVAAAVTPPDRPRGRGRQPESPPVKQEAQSLGIPVLQPPSLRGDEAQSQLASLKPDVIVVAAYGRLLPPTVLELPPHGCLNLHPSLLPKHRGPSPVATAILEGDDKTGVSLMLLDEGMDTGPVIAQEEIELDGQEKADELTDRLFILGGNLLANSIEPWAHGELDAQAQDEAHATLSRKLERADGEADWNLPAEILARQGRAYDPWPGLYTHWQGKVLKLTDTSAQPGLDTGRATPGTVVAPDSGKGLWVATGDGALALHRLQLEGRRPVTSEEFLRGYPDIIGANLTSN